MKEKTRFGFDITQDFKNKIKQEADQHGMTMAGFARMTLKQAVE